MTIRLHTVEACNRRTDVAAVPKSRASIAERASHKSYCTLQITSVSLNTKHRILGGGEWLYENSHCSSNTELCQSVKEVKFYTLQSVPQDDNRQRNEDATILQLKM